MIAENQVKLSKVQPRKLWRKFIYQYGENDLTIVQLELGSGDRAWRFAWYTRYFGVFRYASDGDAILRWFVRYVKVNYLYDDIEKTWFLVGLLQYDRVYEEASSRYIEFIEFLERVEFMRESEISI